tara:strand:+ start:17418 stop:18041 length:624 start_codon:yes stop_codon:yes gene_type:complete
MNLSILDNNGKSSATVEVSDDVFGKNYNEPLIHQVITAYRANARGGNRAQKDRSQVRASTKKPWKQKGTGRARAGSTSSPLWRSGGKTFPSSPLENFSQKTNKRMFNAGMRSIISQLVRDDRLFVVKSLDLKSCKTKELFSLLLGYGQSRSKLLVVESIDRNLELASRNIPELKVLKPSQVDPVSLVKFEVTLVAESSLSNIEERFS